MTRIPEITDRSQVPEAHRAAWDEITASRGSVRGPFKVLLHSPELARRIAHVGAYARFETQIDPYLRELTVIIAARLMDCEYEFVAHRPQAVAAGVSEQAVVAIQEGRADDLSVADRLVYDLVEQLVVQHRVSQETFARARDRFGVPELVELVGIVGYYGMLACALNAFEMEPARA